jgi:TRAP-type C4-dicarboxylate transport system permease large subunit
MCTRKNGAAIKEFFDVSFTIYRTFSRELLNEILVSTIQAAIIFIILEAAARRSRMQTHAAADAVHAWRRSAAKHGL